MKTWLKRIFRKQLSQADQLQKYQEFIKRMEIASKLLDILTQKSVSNMTEKELRQIISEEVKTTIQKITDVDKK